MTTQLRRTPLHGFVSSHGGRMVDFAGWEMPVQFKSIVEEHKATRMAAGLFDVSHMGEALVRGPDAARFLDQTLTNRIGDMEVGQVVYSLMCYSHGGVVDDLLVYRKESNCFFLCLNASNTEKDLAWLHEHMTGYSVEIEDVSQGYALLALQGPKSFEILAKIDPFGFSGLGYYHFIERQLGGFAPCLVSRTGYTGEKGVEVFVEPNYATQLAEAILTEGAPLGLELAGLGARDSLRLEAGYSLYGHEIDEEISPAQAGLMWTVKLKKPNGFIGRDAIAREREAGPSKRIVFFSTGGRRIARPGSRVLAAGKDVGEVRSGTYSPGLEMGIGSALVDAAASKGDLAIDNRGKSMPLSTAKPPFVEMSPQA